MIIIIFIFEIVVFTALSITETREEFSCITMSQMSLGRRDAN